MPDSDAFEESFHRLRTVLQRHADGLVVTKDEPALYYLDTPHIMKNKKPLNFGSVHIRKRYVSFHLMPVYVFPDLLEPVSPELIKRMQGKSCFNFTAITNGHLTGIEWLTAAGFTRYQTEKLLGTP
jgi:hypothetical protein